MSVRKWWILIQYKAAGFFSAAGGAAHRRGVEKPKNAGLGQKMPPPEQHYMYV
jgi:hypothetical protein